MNGTAARSARTGWPHDAGSRDRDREPGWSEPSRRRLAAAHQGENPGAGRGRGSTVVVTDLGIYHFDETGEMRLDSLHAGATVEAVRETIGWDVSVSPDLAETPPPTDHELRLIREELDPGGVYTK